MPGNNNYSTIQGLNIVYPPSDDPTSNKSKDFLTPPSEYSDFTAQLDLWTNLSFASDEPTFINDASRESFDFRNSSVDMHKDPPSVLIANADKLSPSLHLGAPSPTTANVPSSNFDISSFLVGFGIDPFLVPPHPSSPQFKNPITNISNPEAETQHTQRTNKRPRTRKQSLTAATTPVTARSTSSYVSTAPSSSAGSPPDTTTEGADELAGVNSASLSTAEDKRRRNTAASARFRAKKKEREQAMERRSKELESRVNELERECEGLRRENGWLKGLVVGVTSGNPVPIPTFDEPSSLTSQASGSPVIATATLSQDSNKKRKRESAHEE